MTDNEFEKAQKIISDLHKYCFFSQVKMQKECGFTENDFEFLHDLINRQRGELRKKQVRIHKLLKELNQIQDYYDIQKAEIERLKDFCDIYSNEGERAIKEFAARLKEELMLIAANGGGFVPSIIDNLVKEMTEKGGVEE